jgi:hypothetical protein
MLPFNATGPISWLMFTETAPVVTHLRVDASPAGIVEGTASKVTMLGASEFTACGLEVTGGATLDGTAAGGIVTWMHPASATAIKSTANNLFITHPHSFALPGVILTLNPT